MHCRPSLRDRNSVAVTGIREATRASAQDPRRADGCHRRRDGDDELLAQRQIHAHHLRGDRRVGQFLPPHVPQ